MIVKITAGNTEEVIYQALSLLREAGLVSYPTETFYALGANYNTLPAIRKLYDIKDRPRDKAIPLIIGHLEQLSLITDSINDYAQELIKKYWPGPLTLVFNARSGIDKHLVYKNKVAVRMPGESFALKLAKASEVPITATSANISNMPPANDALAVFHYFNDAIDLIIDGGQTGGRLPSTIIDVTQSQLKILRHGAIDLTLH
ncbi:MAG: L-threonylcarbamoyladenylate synthase [Dissulfurispiraceae bacterium]